MEGLHNISVVVRWAILKIDLAVFKILSHKNSMLLEVGEDEDGYYGNDPLFGNGGHHHHLCCGFGSPLLLSCCVQFPLLYIAQLAGISSQKYLF